MSEKTKQFDNCSFQVDLGSEIRTLSGRSLRSLLGLFAHLENLGMRQAEGRYPIPSRQGLFAPQHLSPKHPMLKGGSNGRTCFRRLGRQALRAAKSQVRALHARSQEILSLLVINDWPVAERLWLELMLDCKTPLCILSFLEELWGIHSGGLESNGRTLARHWHQFILIQAEVEILLSRRQSLVELSDALEAQLGAWIKQFGEILEKLDEESIA
jgi:hypothetical protein